MEPKEGFWRKFLRPVLNQRGEVGSGTGKAGEVRNIPGSGAGNIDAGWDAPSDTAASGVPDKDTQGTAPAGGEPPISKEGVTPEPQPTPPADAAGAVPPVEDDLPFRSHPKWKEMEGELERLREGQTKFEANVEQFRNMAAYYQTQLNELMGREPGSREGEVAARATTTANANANTPDSAIPALDPKNLPPDVKPPNAWETQYDMAKYFDYRSDVITNHRVSAALDRAYQSVMLPQFKRIQAVLGALDRHIAKSSFKDFDEVTKSVHGDLFVLDPGGNVIGVKDKALLRYIQEQPMPSLALYNYASSRKAPEKIAAARTDATKTVIDNIMRKPKGPTIPSGSTGSPRTPSGLDWDTDEATADEILRKRGVIK